MRKILLMVFVLCTMVNYKAYAQDPQTFVIAPQETNINRDFLEMFPKIEEQAIILAFENQLDQFVILYNACHKGGCLNLVTNIILEDVGYLFYDHKINNPKDISLEGFFKYLWQVDSEGRYTAIEKSYANTEKDIQNFEKKVKIDYEFIYNQLQTKKKYEDFTEWLKDEQAVKLFLRKVYNRYQKLPMK